MMIAKNIGKVLCAIIVALILIVGCYVAYMQISYYRIDDNLALSTENNSSSLLQTNTTYKALSYNFGFGAYSPEFSFFMDSGILNNGSEVTGTRGTAVSKEDVLKNVQGLLSVLEEQDADFNLLQEIDLDSTRSYNINQADIITSTFSNYSSTFAINYHSPWLALPLYDMHGSTYSGLLSLSKYNVSSATRYSYPVSTGFFDKFTDLDRCFEVLRLPVENGKELVLINHHMSAYDEDGSSRQQQMEILTSFMQAESQAGNYVIVGGDWNQTFIDSSTYESVYDTKQESWASITLDDSSFPEGFSIVTQTNIESVATCRNACEPYEQGHTAQYAIDAFVVSDNVKAESKTLDLQYAYSDHNPVTLTFSLLS